MAKKSPKSSKQRTQFWPLWITAVSVMFVALVLGFLAGTSQSVYKFSPNQSEFIDGIIAGTEYRVEYEEWADLLEPKDYDIRSDPKQRCAGEFFPQRPVAMDGCLQALQERPPGGFKIPHE